MTGPPTIEVILPCLNEVQALGWVIDRMPERLSALVVDNGSDDGSAKMAASYGVRVVHAAQRGYGAACHASLLAATAPVVAVMDADASLHLVRVLEPVLTGEADLVLARRQAARGAFPWQLRVANRALAARIRRRTGVRLHDIGPMRAAGMDFLLGLALSDRRSGYPAETVVRASDAGARIVEVPVDYLPRRGRSKVTGTPLGVWRAVCDLSAAIDR